MSLLCHLQLIDLDDGYMSLMDSDGSMKEDLKLPSNLMGKEIEEKFAGIQKDEQLMVRMTLNSTIKSILNANFRFIICLDFYFYFLNERCLKACFRLSFQVTVMTVTGEEHAIAFKISNQ